MRAEYGLVKRGWIWKWNRTLIVMRFDYDQFTCVPDPWTPDRYEARAMWLANQIRNIARWLRDGHDCQNPKVGCSCYPSSRFPKVQ